ncbi:MAG: hypothetical protein JWN17_1900 [Frankiales bacterium]|nr:hypothetical protein [Frankiales bacterium]
MRSPEAAQAVFALVGVRAGMRPDEAPRNYTTLDAARLRAAALRVAALNGDPRPDSVEWVRTTDGRADRLMSGARILSADGGQSVYLVQLRGKFTTHHGAPAGAPAGADTTTGTVVWFTILDDGETRSFGVQSEPRDLRTLGAVHTEADPAEE